MSAGSTSTGTGNSKLFVMVGIAVAAIIGVVAIVLSTNTAEEDKPIDPTDIDALRKLSVSELMYNGDLFSDKRFYKEALVFYQIALEKDPDNTRALNGAGYCHTQLKAFGKALDSYSKSLKIEPQNVNSYNGIGEINIDLQKYSDAIPYFEESLKIDPENVNAYNGMGISYVHLGDSKKAIQYFEKSLEFNPEKLETYNGLALAHLRSNQTEMAESNYRTVLDIDSDNIDALIGMGIVKDTRGNYTQAELFYDKAQDAASLSRMQILEMIVNEADNLTLAGEYYRALVLYDSILENDQDNHDALNGKANVLIQIGQNDEASLILDETLAMYPDSLKANELKNMLE